MKESQPKPPRVRSFLKANDPSLLPPPDSQAPILSTLSKRKGRPPKKKLETLDVSHISNFQEPVPFRMDTYQIGRNPLRFSILGSSIQACQEHLKSWISSHLLESFDDGNLRFDPCWHRSGLATYFYKGIPILFYSPPCENEALLFNPDLPYEIQITAIKFVFTEQLHDLNIPFREIARIKREEKESQESQDSSILEASQVSPE